MTKANPHECPAITVAISTPQGTISFMIHSHRRHPPSQPGSSRLLLLLLPSLPFPQVIDSQSPNISYHHHIILLHTVLAAKTSRNPSLKLVQFCHGCRGHCNKYPAQDSLLFVSWWLSKLKLTDPLPLVLFSHAQHLLQKQLSKTTFNLFHYPSQSCSTISSPTLHIFSLRALLPWLSLSQSSAVLEKQLKSARNSGSRTWNPIAFSVLTFRQEY